MPAANPSRASRSRFIGIATTVVLVFSGIVPPFVGPSSLVAAIQPSFSQLQQSVSTSRPPELLAVLRMLGFLLFIFGSFLSLVFFAFRYKAGRARAGILACAVGLVLITGTLFDYRGDFASKIFTVIEVGIWPSFAFYGIGYFISWLAIVIGLIASSRGEKKSPQQAPTLAQPMQVSETLVPTGYTALDNLLYGGVPPGSSMILTGPPCDEKNIIVRRFIETNLESGRGCIYISSSIDRVLDLLVKYGKNLQVILCNPQADIIAAGYPDVAKLKTLENLTEVNIEFSKALMKSKPTASVLCLEVLDDVLLDHHSKARRWLMDILGKSKSNQMTSLTTLNPAMHPSNESQAALETFDGHIDLYEAELHVHPKLIRVRKMGGRKFLDNELLVDKEKI